MAFKEPKLSNMLSATGYSFATLYGAFHMAHKVAQEGALHVIAHLAEHDALHKLGHKAGHKAKDLDKVLSRFPVLKKITGPALAGVILYGYTMTEPHKLGDWDLTSVKKALTGEYGIHDFIQSSEAVDLGAHIISGKALSLTALAENMGTLALGLACTAISHSDNPKLKKLGDKVSTVFSSFKPRKSLLGDLNVSHETMKDAFGGKLPKSAEDLDKGDKKTTKPKDTDKKDTDTEATDKEDKESKEKKSGGSWWDNMSDKAKRLYKKEHPNTALSSADDVLSSVRQRLHVSLSKQNDEEHNA